jgi:Tol biopolymer transport system component
MRNYRNIHYLIFIILLLVFLIGCSEKDDIYLCWAEVSPKADKIAVSYVKSGKSGIFILDLQSKKRTNLFEIENELAPYSLSWSPDQTKICYARNLLLSDGATGELGLYLICVFSLTGKRVFSLKDNSELILTYEGMNHAPKWSPAGGFIAFASRRESMTWLSKQDFGGQNLWVVDDKTFYYSKPLTKESNLQHFFAWCWSDDGRYIFYCRRTEKDGNGELCIINPITLEEKVLSSGHRISSYSCWSPDGTRIFFSDRRNPINAYILFLDSDVIRPIFEIGSDNYIAQPKWSPDGRKIAFYKLDENKRWDVWSVDSDGNNPGKIINLSIPAKKGIRKILGWLTNNELIFNRDKKALYSHNISTGLERQIYP